MSALSSVPVDFKGRKIQEKPRNYNREKREVDTGELKKLLEASLKKKNREMRLTLSIKPVVLR